MNRPTHRLAYFITPHGFGHAARAAAVMAAIHEIEPTVHFEIFSKVPRWFFEQSLAGSFRYHDLLTDVGLVQKDSLTEDLPQTVQRLAKLYPLAADTVQTLAAQVNHLDCQLVASDIAPLGLAVAQAAGVPGILIENFTWDWIYEGYAATEPRLQPFVDYLQQIYASADYHLQTEPISRPQPADLTTLPVSRKPRTPALVVRQSLGLPLQSKMVLITMGGVNWEYTFLERLERQPNIQFVVPGPGQQLARRGNVLLLPARSEFYHPDLVHACDVVLGKVGYSTLAEAHHAGIPFGYVARSRFRETPCLVEFIENRMQGIRMSEAQFQQGDWLSRLPDLLALPRLQREEPNGADQVAAFMLQGLGFPTSAESGPPPFE